MKSEATTQSLKLTFFLLSGVLLITFSIVTFIEGIMAQTSGYSLVATVFYFVSMCSVGATIWTYWKAKKTLGTMY